MGVVTQEPLYSEGLRLVILGVGDIVTEEQVLSGHLRKLSTFFVEHHIWSILACAAESAQRNAVATESGLVFRLGRHGTAALLW